jgi:lipopolysaccharide transport system ATP-binding protein
MPTVISVEHLSKSYRLGQIGTGTLSHDLNVWWAKVRGKPNPLLRIGETDHGNRDGETLWALKDVSFKVQQGEVLGIIGRNGAGKSTLLKILSRVTAPTSGKIKVKGRVASLLEVGTGFHPELTGRENIYLNGAILGMSRKEIDRKFDEIVDFAEVEKFIDTPVKRYSSGMYVRLAFAVAAHLDPEILVVDEVLAVGDAEFQKKCLGKMSDIAEGGRTVLFVSHNMGAVASLCGHGLLLKEGIVVQNAAIDDVIQQYMFAKDHYTKQFFRPRKDCSNRIQIKDVNIRSPKKFLDPFTVEISLSVKEKVEKFSIEWFIRNSNGIRVASGLSALYDHHWFVPGQQGDCEVKSILSEWVYPGGQYYLSVMVTIPLIECFDYVEDVCEFNIPHMNPGDGSFIFSHSYGVTLPSVEWYSVGNLMIKAL